MSDSDIPHGTHDEYPYDSGSEMPSDSSSDEGAAPTDDGSSSSRIPMEEDTESEKHSSEPRPANISQSRAPPISPRVNTPMSVPPSPMSSQTSLYGDDNVPDTLMSQPPLASDRGFSPIHNIDDDDQDMVSREDSDDDEEVIDALGDPLYIPAESLFRQDEDGDDDDDQELHDALPPAFYEHPAIRNAYIRIFAMHAFDGVTKVVVHKELEMIAAFAKSMEAMLPKSTNATPPKLDGVARTLTTLERRLGIL
ncbi:hypothetical protein BOTBODRAFT_180835 [Botryobasidium botryosum FD-172 SS1]|uniref:Uncharacterized protein n=1 Tax=Botryobasidium botryosum (strain FD-172 SS1) TaxID=930990 RepID=A0A067LYB1_BOTB1|nr:hypothetical protein BOTBODRAFT_180835 [Botryobasidium botryosum FD-172 SS1]